MLRFFLSALLSLCFFVFCIRFDRFRIGVLYALTSLCLCFPVYAEDEAYTFDSEITEFTYLQNNELKLNQVENNIIQDEIQTQEEISAILSEPLADPSPILRSSNSSDSNFQVTGFQILPSSHDDAFRFRVTTYGSPLLDALKVTINGQRYDGVNAAARAVTPASNYTIPNSESLLFGSILLDVFDFSDSVNGDLLYSANITVTPDMVGSYIGSGHQFEFLSIIDVMISWFLGCMSALTTWILADSMAAVYACIFLVGCAIAMLFRVLRSA